MFTISSFLDWIVVRHRFGHVPSGHVAGSHREAHQRHNRHAWSHEKRKDVRSDRDPELKLAESEARGNPHLKEIQKVVDLEFRLW